MAFRVKVARSLHVGLYLTLAGACGVFSTEVPGEGDDDDAEDTDDTETDSEGEDTSEDDVGDSGGDGTDFEPLEISCGEPPMAAVGASYRHQPMAMGGAMTYAWSATDLPPGLILNPVTGEIAGTPELEGQYVIALRVESGADPVIEAETDCTIEVGPPLSVDLDGLDGPCVDVDDDIHDLMVGGDGTAITCSILSGSGNGELPQGVTVDEETCVMAGTVTDARYGTWVWMVAVEQSGFEVVVPFCATQPDPAADAVSIVVDHGSGTDNGLVPATGTFTAGADVVYGEPGNPTFTITGDCGPGCSWGYFLGFGGSPFDEISVATPVDVAAGNGFTHGLTALGPPAQPRFEGRPWTVALDLTYCLASDTTTCDGVDNIMANANGTLRFFVIMNPE